MESQNYRSVAVRLSIQTIDAIDSLRKEWGIHSRSDIIERILNEVLTPDMVQDQSSDPE
jgi:metal-responsive CopG/Arc/MetJ family transcriptional regulator